jgi:outer membrane protein insertion porin family
MCSGVRARRNVDRRLSARIPRASALAVLMPLLPLQAPDQLETPPLIERIEIANNQFLQKETLLFYISTKPGEPFDERKLRADFRRLWDTGFLDDLRVDAVDGPRGKVVTFFVTERRRIQIVDYRGSKELTQSTIETK